MHFLFPYFFLVFYILDLIFDLILFIFFCLDEGYEYMVHINSEEPTASTTSHLKKQNYLPYGPSLLCFLVFIIVFDVLQW